MNLSQLTRLLVKCEFYVKEDFSFKDLKKMLKELNLDDEEVNNLLHNS